MKTFDEYSMGNIACTTNRADYESIQQDAWLAGVKRGMEKAVAVLVADKAYVHTRVIELILSEKEKL